MLVDVHAKSSISQGVDVHMEDVLERAADAGLDAVAFCETLTTARCTDPIEAAQRYGVTVFAGVEIPSDNGILLGFPPEIDGFFLNEEWRQIAELTIPSSQLVIEMFDDIGGAVIASRPYDLEIPHNMGDLVFTLDGIAAVEVFNSRVGSIQNDFAVEAASFMGLPTAGGSDPKNSDDVIGRFATYFDAELTSQEEFVNALRDDEYWGVKIGDVDRKKSSRKKSRRRGRGGKRRGRR